jgi:hypothetical protein
MKTEKSLTQTFLVLVPHRDVRIELQKYSDLAQEAAQKAAQEKGLAGVYNFPHVAPLASLSQALTDSELKQIAHSLRKNIGNNKIFAKDGAVTVFPCYKKDLSLTGPCLDIVIPQNIFDSGSKKINAFLSPLIIGCFLMPEFTLDSREDNIKFNAFREIPCKKMEFRAAAVANMYWRSLQLNDEIYYKWKIGKLCWLPRPGRLK